MLAYYSNLKTVLEPNKSQQVIVNPPLFALAFTRLSPNFPIDAQVVYELYAAKDLPLKCKCCVNVSFSTEVGKDP